jgi:hypothetical protein
MLYVRHNIAVLIERQRMSKAAQSVRESQVNLISSAQNLVYLSHPKFAASSFESLRAPQSAGSKFPFQHQFVWPWRGNSTVASTLDNLIMLWLCDTSLSVPGSLVRASILASKHAYVHTRSPGWVYQTEAPILFRPVAH